MAGDSISTANYYAVIADLEARREALDQTISKLKEIAGVSLLATATKEAPMIVTSVLPPPPSRSVPTLATQTHTAGGPTRTSVVSGTGATGIGEACANILHSHRDGHSGLSTRQVTDALLSSGFILETANPTNNVWSALAHRAKVAGDVERVGKNWRSVSKAPSRTSNDSQPQMNGPSSH